MKNLDQAKVTIRYCPRCKWLLRAGWYAQELLSTFSDDLTEVSLVPSSDAGIFTIEIGDAMLMDRKVDGFLEAKEIKRRIRDHIDPERSLGHIDS